MILSIDPSSRSAGWAIFKRKEYFLSGVIKSNKKDFYKNSLYIADQLDGIFLAEGSGDNDIVLIEYPELFSSNTGITAVRSGSLVKLSVTVGIIAGLLSWYSYAEIKFIKPKEWKGQLSKEITLERILKKIDIKKKIKTYDECDAIGMGLYYLGEF